MTRDLRVSVSHHDNFFFGIQWYTARLPLKLKSVLL